MTTSHRKELAHTPLAEIVPRLTSLVAGMTIAEVAALLGGAPAPPAPQVHDGAPVGALGSLDEIARAILALPNSRHRIREVERAVVMQAIAKTKGNVSAAARLLGTERKALERRIERYKIAVRRGR